MGKKKKRQTEADKSHFIYFESNNQSKDIPQQTHTKMTTTSCTLQCKQTQNPWVSKKYMQVSNKLFHEGCFAPFLCSKLLCSSRSVCTISHQGQDIVNSPPPYVLGLEWVSRDWSTKWVLDCLISSQLFLLVVFTSVTSWSEPKGIVFK